VWYSLKNKPPKFLAMWVVPNNKYNERRILATVLSHKDKIQS